MRQAFFDGLLARAKDDESVRLLACDVGYGPMDRFRDELPRQFMNMGIAEQNAVSVAAGMAKEGLKPFVCSITPFLVLKALEQIKLDVLLNNAPVVLVGIGVDDDYAKSGPTHQCQEDITLMKAIGMERVFTTNDKAYAYQTALYVDGPAYVRLRKSVKG